MSIIMKVKYSIIIPTKNRAYSLWKAIESVVNQSFGDWELLVVDGGSTDGTEKLVNGFNNPKISFIVNPNDIGVASARNYGIKSSKGDFIGYLDSDDYFLPNWLFEMDKYIHSHPNKMLYMPNKNFTIKVVDKNNKTDKILIQNKLFTKPRFSAKSIINLDVQCDTNGMIHSKAAIDQIGYWNETLPLYEDYEFILRFVERYPKGIAYVSKVLVSYTRAYGKDSLCSDASYQKLVDCLEKVYLMHGHKKFMSEQNWFPRLRDKYQKMALEEKLTGRGILDRILEKYSQHE